MDKLPTALPEANNILQLPLLLLLLWRVVKDEVEGKARMRRSNAEARVKDRVKDKVKDRVEAKERVEDKDKVEDSAAENE